MNDLNEYIYEVEEKCGYTFTNKDLLYQAFTRKSYTVQYGGENNEVLELLGDTVLDFYVTKIISQRYGFLKSETQYYDSNEENNEFCLKAHKDEQDVTEIKKEIVSNINLAKRIDKLGFNMMMYLGQSDIDNKVWAQLKVKADLFEAILGAIAIDSNWNPNVLQYSVEFMLQIDDKLDDVNDGMDELKENLSIENAVTTLKELSESRRCSIPEYEIPDEQVYYEGEYWWSCTCYVNNWRLEKTVLSKSKKSAKKHAAYLVLCDHYNIEVEI